MSRMIKTAIAVLAFAGTFVPAALAQSEPGQEAVSINVAASDLDLSTPQGGRTLLGRIEDAANRICSDRTGAKPGEDNSYRCRRRTVETAVRGANLPMLTLAWSGKGQTTYLATR